MYILLAGRVHSRCPDVGGALRLGGAGDTLNCSFLSNSASAHGLIITAVAKSVNIGGSSFDGNKECVLRVGLVS